MSARKIPLFKKFLEVPTGPVPAVFPIPEGELVKINFVADPLLPVHPDVKIATSDRLIIYVKKLDDAACMQLLAVLEAAIEPANNLPSQQN
jgi:hypothetical protein